MRRCARGWRPTSRQCETGVDDWLSYRPSDFLMFSPRVYWRLFESMNEAWWPAQPILLALGAACLLALGRPGPGGAGTALRVSAGLLAGCWALAGWVFMLERFVPVNWPARGYAALFLLQAAALLVPAVAGSLRLAADRLRRGAALMLGLWALAVHPLLAAADGRPWTQAEVFGLAPDPTAIGTLAFLLAVRGESRAARRWLRGLWLLPLAWCVLSAITLATMGSPQAWAILAAAVLAAATAWRR